MKKDITMLALCAAVFLCTSCADKESSPLVISDIEVLAPLPGSDASVAYFVIENNTDANMSVQGVDSEQFETVEMHETTLVDGVSRMRKLEAVEILSHSSVAFETGGKHLMLMNPVADISVGAAVTLEIQVDDALVVISAMLKERPALN